jgi:hypothetical protein
MSSKLGRSPRTLFEAASNPVKEKTLEKEINMVIKKISLPQLETMIKGLSSGDTVPHQVVEIWPPAGDKDRLLVDARVGPISVWVLALLIRQKGIATAENVQRLFAMFRPISEAGSMVGKIWEVALRIFFRHVNRILKMKRLRVKSGPERPAKRNRLDRDDCDLDLRNLAVYRCQTDEECAACIQRHFEEDTGCYIQPSSKTFPSFDAGVFRPGKPFLVLQDTIARDHKINYAGLERGLKWFVPPAHWPEEKKKRFEQYLPENHLWQIVFVVDDDMANSYDEEQDVTCGKKQKTPELEEFMNKWKGLLEQFVLEVKCAEVFAGLVQLEERDFNNLMPMFQSK